MSMFGSTKTRSPYRKEIPDGPIHDFWTVVETTPAEEWQRRTSALSTLISVIPTGSDYNLDGTNNLWYNSPGMLRHLASPLSELIRDPRSTVVKRTCESTTELFAKCQIEARYLLKDIMPTILSVHAQTVQVIRSYVQTMVIDAMSVVPCKMAMPLWLERLKSDKSRTVREACAIYLGVALNEWCDGGNAGVPNGYLTTEIWNQVGLALIRSLRDPAPAVRQHARRGLETIHLQQSNLFQHLVDDANINRDPRVKKLLSKINAGIITSNDDNMSVGSSRNAFGGGGGGNGSVVSRGSKYGTSSHHRSSGSVRSSSNRKYGTVSSSNYGRSSTGGGSVSRNKRNSGSGNSSLGIPRRIVVGGSGGGGSGISNTTGTPRGGGGTSGTNNNTFNNKSNKNNTNGSSNSGGGGLGPPLRVVPFRAAIDTPNKNDHHHRQNGGFTTPTAATAATATVTTPTTPSNNNIISNNNNNNNSDNNLSGVTPLTPNGSFDTLEPVTELPIIATVEELREHAKKRNSRRSSLLQQRLQRSFNDGNTNTTTNTNTNSNSNNGESSNNGGVEEFDENILDKLILDDTKATTINTTTNNNNIGSLNIDTTTTTTTTGNGSNNNKNNNATTTNSTSTSTSDILSIANELLEAHKTHVDKIMESLRIEMDILKDFEFVVMEEITKRGGGLTPTSTTGIDGTTIRPTEEEVLHYFESIGLCLDQRTTAGNILRRSMDKISKG